MPTLKKSRPKLVGEAQRLASKYIAEEIATRQYSSRQAIAIGISRARKKVAELRLRRKRVRSKALPKPAHKSQKRS